MKKNELKAMAIRKLEELLSLYRDIDLPFNAVTIEFYREEEDDLR